MQKTLATTVAGLLGLTASASLAQEVQTSVGPLAVTPVAEGLEEPWAIGFLPDGAFLVTEIDGRLKHFPAPGAEPVLVDGGPEVAVVGQGGLLDVMIPADFAQTREVWLSYATAQRSGEGTAVGKGRLSDDGTRLEGFTQLFAIPEGSSGGRHFGSRLVEATDGTVFLTVGDRGTGPLGMQAQDPMRGEGKVIHLNRDGSPAIALSGTKMSPMPNP